MVTYPPVSQRGLCRVRSGGHDDDEDDDDEEEDDVFRVLFSVDGAITDPVALPQLFQNSMKNYGLKKKCRESNSIRLFPSPRYFQ